MSWHTVAELHLSCLPQPCCMRQGNYGTIVAPGVNAQNHQHMFCARLDFALDCAQGGQSLIVTEVCLGCWGTACMGRTA